MSELYLKWADIIIRFLQTVISWPVAILIIALYYRVALEDLLSRLAEGSFPGGSLKFNSRVDEAKTEAALKEIKQASANTENENQSIVADLLNRTNISEKDKTNYQAKFKQNSEKIAEMQKKQIELEYELKNAKLYQKLAELSREQINFLRAIVKSVGLDNFSSTDKEQCISKLESVVKRASTNMKLKSWMMDLGIVGQEGSLLPGGYKVFKIIADKMN